MRDKIRCVFDGKRFCKQIQQSPVGISTDEFENLLTEPTISLTIIFGNSIFVSFLGFLITSKNDNATNQAPHCQTIRQNIIEIKLIRRGRRGPRRSSLKKKFTKFHVNNSKRYFRKIKEKHGNNKEPIIVNIPSSPTNHKALIDLSLGSTYNKSTIKPDVNEAADDL